MGSERTRYVAFDPPSPRPSRHAFNEAIGPPSWRLTVYTSKLGILRVPHTSAHEAREALKGMGAVPLTTSGTIKAAKERARNDP